MSERQRGGAPSNRNILSIRNILRMRRHLNKDLTVTSYISFCEDICIPTRTFLSFNNDKPWFTGKLKQLRQAKEDAYRSGDKILYNQARNRLTKEIRVAKKNYSEKLKK